VRISDIGTDIGKLLRAIIAVLPPEGVMLRVGMTNPPYILEHLPVIAGAPSPFISSQLASHIVISSSYCRSAAASEGLLLPSHPRSGGQRSGVNRDEPRVHSCRVQDGSGLSAGNADSLLM